MRYVLLTGLALAASAQAADPDPRSFGWGGDYAAAKAEAKKAGKPLLVVFRCER
jgi:hypothetical protein